MEESLRMEENFEKEKSLKKETTAGMEDSLRMIADSFPLDAQKVRTYSALSFAYEQALPEAEHQEGICRCTKCRFSDCRDCHKEYRQEAR